MDYSIKCHSYIKDFKVYSLWLILFIIKWVERKIIPFKIKIAILGTFYAEPATDASR